jgi:hypothetical protein
VARFFALSLQPALGPAVALEPVELARALFENCIASTSILKIPSYKEPTVDALAPDADEGRGWLR